MDDTFKEIDAVLLPNMLEMNVKEALEKAASLCVEMRESADLCKYLLDRLRFLRKYLPTRKSKLPSAADYPKVLAQFANTLGLVIRFFKSHSVKTLLQRIAANRLIIKQIERLHEKIDGVFRAANLSNSTEMNEWKEHKANDIAQLQRTLEESSRNTKNLVGGLSGSALEEVLTELQSEIDPLKNQYEFRVFLERVLDTVVKHIPGTQIPDIPVWYIHRDDIEVDEEIDIGAFGAVHRGKWGDGGTEVVMKLLCLDGPDIQKLFLREADVWYKLNHPYVIKMLGGCHVGKPLLFVAERANYGNFTDYLYCTEHKSKLWRLFHQAAQGLAYLHGQRVIHGNLKCNNILVGNDGNAKLCDFGFSYIRTLSLGKDIKEQPRATRWQAPECLLEQGSAANPSFQSDVFSLGMSIIEAKIGGVPWGMRDDDYIIDQLADGEGYPRPYGVFTDKEWNLIRSMTAFEPVDRVSLLQVIETLDELAKDQEAEEKRTKQMLRKIEAAKQNEPEPEKTVKVAIIQCPTCLKETASNKFCGECGVLLCVGIQPLERLEIAAIPNSFNEKRARDAYEGTPIQQDQPTAEANIPQQQLAKDILVIDSDHGEHRDEGSSPLGHVGEQDKHEATTDAPDDRAALLNRIKELEKQLGIQNYPGYEELTGRFCNNCGDLNPIDNFFCSECGNDIEVIRRNKL